MDQELKQRLDSLAAELGDVKKDVSEMRGAFFEVPMGSDPETTKTFFQELQTIVKAWQNGSWTFRLASYVIGAVLFLGTAISTMGEWSWLPWNK